MQDAMVRTCDERAMGTEVQGSRRRGRPKKRWADCERRSERLRRPHIEVG